MLRSPVNDSENDIPIFGGEPSIFHLLMVKLGKFNQKCPPNWQLFCPPSVGALSGEARQVITRQSQEFGGDAHALQGFQAWLVGSTFCNMAWKNVVRQSIPATIWTIGVFQFLRILGVYSIHSTWGWFIIWVYLITWVLGWKIGKVTGLFCRKNKESSWE